MPDLRKKMHSILKRYGHDIYLQRRINDYTSETPEYETKLSKHTVRRSYVKKLGSVTQEDPEGITHDFDMMFYFESTANPQEGDRIYDDIEKTPGEMSTWLIDIALPMRFRNGRVEYWAVGVSREHPSS